MKIDCEKEYSLESSFERLCQNVYKLIIKECIPVDIEIRFVSMMNDNKESQLAYDKCRKIFEVYLVKDKLLNEYKPSIYNPFKSISCSESVSGIMRCVI